MEKLVPMVPVFFCPELPFQPVGIALALCPGTTHLPAVSSLKFSAEPMPFFQQEIICFSFVVKTWAYSW